MGRPPTVSSVNVQLKSVISSHDVGSIHVSFASEEMSSELEHPVGLLVGFDEVFDEALEVTVEEPEGRIEEPEPSIGESEVPEPDDEPVFSAVSAVASVDFERTLITFFATRAPTTDPTIARTAMTPAIQSPTAC